MIIGKRIASLINSPCFNLPTRSISSFTFFPQYHFATSLLERFRSNNESELMFRSTNLSFKSDSYSMYVYFVHPKCIPIINNYTINFYSIEGDNAVVLTFYPKTTEGMEEGSYEQRKSILLSFKDIITFLQISPLSAQKTEIQQKYQDQKTYTRKLTIQDKPQSKQINIHLSASSMKQNEEDELWQLAFPLKYPQYRVFIEYLKKNLTYISGAALMLEKSKQEELEKVTHERWTRKN